MADDEVNMSTSLRMEHLGNEVALVFVTPSNEKALELFLNLQSQVATGSLNIALTGLTPAPLPQ